MSQQIDVRVVAMVLARIGVDPKRPSAKALESADSEKLGRFPPEIQAMVVSHCVRADKYRYQGGSRRHRKW